MLGYFPKAYPDELIYSVLSRAYVGNGFITYREFAQEVQDNKGASPSVEFLGLLKPEIVSSLIQSYDVRDIDELIMKGTQYLYYTRFYTPERKKQALDAIRERKNIADLIRPTTQTGERHLRYCSKCALDDRCNYGQTYWHRSHQLKGIDVCPIHGIRLIDSLLVLSGKASPMYVAAETIIDDMAIMTEETAPLLEVQLAGMHFDLLVYQHTYDAKPLNVIKQTLYEKGYYSPRAMSIHLQDIENDLQCFYKDMPAAFLNKAQISKLLSGKRRTPNEICIMALFLGLTVNDLICDSTFNIEDQIKAFDRKVLEMIDEGHSVIGTARILGMEKQTISSIKNGKRTSEKGGVRGRGGAKPKDWNALDNKYLPVVEKIVDDMKEKQGERPVRITAFMVAKELGLQPRTFSKLVSCTTYVSKYYETQEQFWAREIEWAYHHINDTGDKMQYASFRKLLNVRRSYMVAALPFIKDDSIRIAVENLSEK